MLGKYFQYAQHEVCEPLITWDLKCHPPQVILTIFAFKKLLMGFHICEESTWDYQCHHLPPVVCYSCVEIISMFVSEGHTLS